MIRDDWSPEAVANSRSSGEKARSRIALLCGRKVRYAFSNLGLPPLAVSISLTPPSSSPIAIKELVLQLMVQNGIARSVGSFGWSMA